jgi:hypothetical protein
VVQVLEHLPSKHEAEFEVLNSNPTTRKKGKEIEGEYDQITLYAYMKISQ